MDNELRDIKTVLDSMNNCLYQISSNLLTSSNQPCTPCVPTSSSYEPSVQNSANNVSMTMSRMASTLENIQSSVWQLTQAVQTLAEIQCCMLAHTQGEIPEKRSLPWGDVHFKNGWVEDMEPSETNKNLEENSF